MAFDAYRQYQKDQRKQRRWEITLPIFIVAVLLLILAIAFHGAYVRSHAKPKPAAAEVTFYDVQTSGFEPGHAIGNPGTVWIKCNAGMDVTDLNNCPEYRTNNAYLAYVAAQARKHKRNHYHEAYGTSGGGWLVKEANIDRSPSTYIFDNCESLGGSSGPGYSQTTFKCGGIDVQMNWGQAPKAEAKVPGITWSTTPLPAEPYNPLAHDGDMGSHGSLVVDGSECVGFKGFHYSEAAHGCLEDGYPCFKDCGADYYMPHFIQCPSKDCLRDPSAETPPAGYVTTPQDITNLMEQIAPTWRTDASGITWFPDGSMICSRNDGCPVPMPAEIEAHKPKKPDCPKGMACNDLAGRKCSIDKPCYCTDREADGMVIPCDGLSSKDFPPPAVPDCKMPADVDVCPQTVDPKGSHD